VGDKGKGNVKAPDFSKDYEKGIQIGLKYLPKQLAAEYGYRQQYDPLLIEQQLGLQHKYDPALAQEQRDALQRRDPQWLAMHEDLGGKIKQALDRGYIDKTRQGAYQALGNQVTGDTLRGTTMDPATKHQTIQAILARSPGLSYGEAQDMAAAVYTGQRGQQLLQQRQQATNQFLGQQSESGQALAQAGSYLSSPSTISMENQIGQVQAPRSFGYVNPNAGYQGAQYGLQNFQNMLAANNQGGASSNPWMNALQGASTGASYGSVGGGYGAAGGAVTGAVAGAFGYPQFSDERLKTNISRTGLSTPDGIPIVDYDYNGKRWRGVLAQEVLTVKPEAVFCFPGGTLGVFYDRIGVKVQEVQHNG
jgi:hypothetical protein